MPRVLPLDRARQVARSRWSSARVLRRADRAFRPSRVRGSALGWNIISRDGISLTLASSPAHRRQRVLFSWDVEHRPNEFFFWLLLVVGGSYGVFLSADLFLLFVFYELVIVPKYFLIAIWGSTNKEYGAMKLTLYSFFGGALVFIGIIAIYVTAGKGSRRRARSPAARAISISRRNSRRGPSRSCSSASPSSPASGRLHTWAPTGHVAAPTAGSMLLAGIVMKLGAYGALRVAMNLFPDGFHMWRKWIAVLGVIGIVYAAAVALRQRDLKFVIGYSSVSHMGFVLARARDRERARRRRRGPANVFARRDRRPALRRGRTHDLSPHPHARSRRRFRGMGLGRALPFAAFCFRHRFSGVDGHSRVSADSRPKSRSCIGTWKAYPIAVLVTGAGMVLVAAFTLRALKKTFFGDAGQPRVDRPLRRAMPMMLGFADRSSSHPITAARKSWARPCSCSPLSRPALYPKFLLDRIMPAVEAMRWLKP